MEEQVLCCHRAAKMTHFTVSKGSPTKERLLGSGAVTLVKADSINTIFLKIGNISHPLLPRSKCWRVNNTCFVIPVVKSFWRLDLLYDDSAGDRFERVLAQHTRFQVDPLPLDRSLFESDRDGNIQWSLPRLTIRPSPLPPKTSKTSKFEEYSPRTITQWPVGAPQTITNIFDTDEALQSADIFSYLPPPRKDMFDISIDDSEWGTLVDELSAANDSIARRLHHVPPWKSVLSDDALDDELDALVSGLSLYSLVSRLLQSL